MRFYVAAYLPIACGVLPGCGCLCYMLPTYLQRWPTPQLPAPATTVLPTYTKNHEFTSQVHFVSIFLARPPTSTATLLYLFGTIGHHHSIDQNGGSKSMDF